MAKSKRKECSVCGAEISEAISAHTDRCKDCDTLRPRERAELSIKTRMVKYLGLIYQELRYIRNSIQGGEKDNDEDRKEDAEK